MRVYLDVCCLCRFTDDQSQPRIRTESEALERVMAEVRRGTIELVSSEALEDEVRRNPDADRRIETQALLSFAAAKVIVDEFVAARAAALVAAGYGPYDALHLASAEAVGADVLLTTDDGFLRRAGLGVGRPRIPVANPVLWVQEQRL